MKTVRLLVLMVFLVGLADAARVGVVIDDGTDIAKKCYDLDDGEGMDALCSKSGNTCDYSWGAPFITRLNGVTCSTQGTCDDPVWGSYPTYWSIYQDGSYSMVGISDITAEDEMVLGFACGCGDAPSQSADFCDICECKKGKRIPKIMGYSILPSSGKKNNSTASDVEITEDTPFEVRLIDNKTGKPIRNAVVDVLHGTPGISAPIDSVKTEKNGLAVFTLEKGSYTVRITGTQYPHTYIDVSVLEETTTTTSTSTTLATTTTTEIVKTTTTTLNLPKHIDIVEQNMDEKKATPDKPLVAGMAASDVKEHVEVDPTDKNVDDDFLRWLFGFFVGYGF
ncbi:MAG: carboxypeptidase-like regulatory domain-containing protein [Candidatus Altiarchaeota archaeon]|nr:carboxypeptidase-like regulatory domain-containing protein [Candidatus Altiarchaeota archaeon]